MTTSYMVTQQYKIVPSLVAQSTFSQNSDRGMDHSLLLGLQD